MAGDWVFIPEKRPRDESGSTDQHHKFLRRGEPSRLRLQVLDNGRPLASQPYELQVDGQTLTGTTDAEGMLQVDIPGNAQRAKLTVGTPPNQRVYNLALGGVESIDSLRGVQQRLKNLGYNCAISGRYDDLTRQALRAFQRDNQLPDTGEADQATKQKLVEKHGC
jgi:peptidoglycan hydrolase-like protein with peptidoglycan-binding domain